MKFQPPSREYSGWPNMSHSTINKGSPLKLTYFSTICELVLNSPVAL